MIYCRVSTKEQVDEGNSLVTQERICKDYALKHGYEVAELFIEQGESAKTAQRTELQRLLRYCSDRKNNIRVVIAYKIDRISRNIDDYSQIRVLLKRYGVEIKSTSEHFENTPAGRFMENIIANVAQFDNDVRTERSVNGMKEAMREGRYVWKAPYGYVNAEVVKKTTIIPDANAPLVTMLFNEVAKNAAPVSEIRRMMEQMGMKNSSGNPLGKAHFYRLLKNEVYAGWIIKFGERHKGLFEPLVSQEVFDQVQRVLKRRSHKGFVYVRENPDFPLRRFVKHPAGYKLTGGWSQGKTQRYPYYRFNVVPGSGIAKEKLENLFVAFLNSFAVNPQLLDRFRDVFIAAYDRGTKEEFREAEHLRAHINELKERQTVLIDKNCDGVITNSVLQDQLDIIEGKIMQAESRLLSLPDKEQDLEEAFSQARVFLEKPGQAWREASIYHKVKLQEFKFPQGVVFSKGKFRTRKIASIFKVKNLFLAHESPMVPLRLPDFEHPVNNPLKSMKYILKTVSAIKTLAELNPSKDNQSK